MSWRHSLMDNVNELEERDIRRSSELALNTLTDELTYLGAISSDWAAWDDTYAFIVDRNDAYIQSNVVDVAFTGLDINLMVFLDISGHIVYARAFDLENQREVPLLPESRVTLLQAAPFSITPTRKACGTGYWP
jgi:sensor domain CHASE-containing protein